MSNYITKSDLEVATDINTPKFSKKVGVTNLKLDVDKLDSDKLKTVPVNSSKLSDVVKN